MARHPVEAAIYCTPERQRKARESVWQRISPEPNSGCWLWTGSVNKAGYGLFWTGAAQRLAHRCSYELHVGPIPAGLTLDHLCRVRCCVNPDHLEPVTQGDNARRSPIIGIRSGELQRSKTHCPKGHAYTGENLIIRENGWRRCRACKLGCQNVSAKTRTVCQ
jgi:hypothetical protein